MKLLRCLMATSLLVVVAVAAHAQFFTIQSDNDTSNLSRDPYASEFAPTKDSFNDTKLAQKQPARKSVQENRQKRAGKIPETTHKTAQKWLFYPPFA